MREWYQVKENIDYTHSIAFDLLRIFCAFTIVLLHASAHVWYHLPLTSPEWLFANACNAFTRFGVPVFVMISGALFLSSRKIIDVKRLWRKNILRLFVVYVVWCVTYGCVHYFSENAVFSFKPFVKSVLAGNYHLWFIPMLLGIYALLPILRRCVMVSTKDNLLYFLILFFIFQIVFTTLSCLLAIEELNAFLSSFTVAIAFGYVGYFVLGHYLYSVKLYSSFEKVAIYVLFPFCYVSNVILSTYLSRRAGQPVQDAIDSFGIFTFFASISIFVFFTQVFRKIPPFGKSANMIRAISKSTLGIYLMHLLVMESPCMLPAFQVLSPFASIPLVTILTFLISLVIATLLRKIPLVGKYIC